MEAAKALLIIERSDALALKEDRREIRNVVDISSAKKRTGTEEIKGFYFGRYWCKENPVKIESRIINGERVRFIWIWQENQKLIPVRYWGGE